MIIRVSKKPQQFTPMKCYEKRKTTLSYCGYASYPEYLASAEWKAIRKEKLSKKPNCTICQKAANQVHHLDYMEGTLLGLWMDRLVSLCRDCHEKIEFNDDGEKLPLQEVNGRLFKLACTPNKFWHLTKKWFRHVQQLQKSRQRKQGRAKDKEYKRIRKQQREFWKISDQRPMEA